MNSPKHILMICKSLPWRFSGGIQTHTWELAQALVSQNQKVTVLTGGAFLKPQTVYQKDTVRVVEIPFFPGRYLRPISYISEELSFNLRVRAWVKKHHQNYDVIHAQGRSGYLLAFDRILRNKLVTTFHGLISRENSNTKWYHFNERLHAAFVKILERVIALKSAISIGVSKSLINDLKKVNPEIDNIQLIHNGVKIHNIFKRSGPQKTGHFLFVGRLHPIKSLDKLIRAFEYASPGVKLDIIGDGPAYKDLKNLVVQSDLENRIQFLGAVDNQLILPLISSYSALVLPSVYETQGIVLLEANAQAIPVIASDLPAIRESVTHGHNGLLCNPQDGRSFVEAMNFLCKDPEYASIMGARGYLHVQANFGWENIADQTIQVYQKLAS